MKNEDFVKEITNIDEDFAQWYTDICLKAELADYTASKGFVAIRPYGYAIYENIHTPFEYFNHIKKFNTREISKLITQDTLVLAGEGDIYTVFYREQMDALVNAKSVTGRLFTREESADHHCQVGNMGLLLDTISEWIREKCNG